MQSRTTALAPLLLALALAGHVAGTPAIAASGSTEQATPTSSTDAKPKQRKAVDRSGKRQKGKASYYSRKFSGKKMASGKPMNPKANVAASKTLPLGTKAKVTNLENEKSTTVRIED